MLCVSLMLWLVVSLLLYSHESKKPAAVGGAFGSRALLRALSKAERRRTRALVHRQRSVQASLRRLPRVVFSKTVADATQRHGRVTVPCPTVRGFVSAAHGRRHAMLYVMGGARYRTCLAKVNTPGFLELAEGGMAADLLVASGSGTDRRSNGKRNTVSRAVRRAVAREDRKLKALFSAEKRVFGVEGDLRAAREAVGTIAGTGAVRRVRIPGTVPTILFNADTSACAKSAVARVHALFRGDGEFKRCIAQVRGLAALRAVPGTKSKTAVARKPTKSLLLLQQQQQQQDDDDDGDDDGDDDDKDNGETRDDDVAAGDPDVLLAAAAPEVTEEPDVLITTTKGKGYCWPCHWARVRAAKARAAAGRARAARARAARARAARARALAQQRARQLAKARAAAARQLRIARARAAAALARARSLAAQQRARDAARRERLRIGNVLRGAIRNAGKSAPRVHVAAMGARASSRSARCAQRASVRADRAGFAHGGSDAVLLRRCLVAAATRHVQVVRRAARETRAIRIAARNPLLDRVPAGNRRAQEKALTALAQVRAQRFFQSLIAKAQRSYLGPRFGRSVDLERVAREAPEDGKHAYGSHGRAGEASAAFVATSAAASDDDGTDVAPTNTNTDTNTDDGTDSNVVGQPGGVPHAPSGLGEGAPM
jgi:hypothetical protein